MHLNLLQFIALSFVFGWTGGQVLQQGYMPSLLLGLLGAFIAAYLNNAHGIVFNKIKSIFKSIKSPISLINPDCSAIGIN